MMTKSVPGQALLYNAGGCSQTICISSLKCMYSSPLGIYPREIKEQMQRKYMFKDGHTTFVHNSKKNYEQSKWPMMANKKYSYTGIRCSQ